MEQGGSTPDQEPELEFVHYQPPAQQPPRRRVGADPRPRWERYVADILSASPHDILIDILRSLPAPRQPGEEIQETAKRLAQSILRDQDECIRKCKELLLVNLCIILQKQFYHPPKELDEIIGVISGATSPKYLDTLKRGANMANAIVVKWAVGSGGQSGLSRIGLATSIVFQGTASTSVSVQP